MPAMITQVYQNPRINAPWEEEMYKGIRTSGYVVVADLGACDAAASEDPE